MPSSPQEAARFFTTCTPIAFSPRQTRHCVYALYSNGAVVYIGVTGDIQGRLLQHAASGKVFDAYEALECDSESEALELEFHLVAKLAPVLNKVLPSGRVFGYASLDTIKRETGIGLRELKRIARELSLEPLYFRDQVNYRVNDFASATGAAA